ncbi:MAG: hypothetical protein ACOZIN_17180 [Myxococcota bacterium]
MGARQEKMTVLDLGAGTGYFALPLAKQGARVIGADVVGRRGVQLAHLAFSDDERLGHVGWQHQLERANGVRNERIVGKHLPGLPPTVCLEARLPDGRAR